MQREESVDRALKGGQMRWETWKKVDTNKEHDVYGIVKEHAQVE